MYTLNNKSLTFLTTTQRANMQNLKYVTRDDNAVQLEIDLTAQNYSVNGHAVESVTLYADEECIGDLAVNWKFEEADGADYTHNTQLMMRDNSSKDNITATMGEFYWDGCFDEQLADILTEAGFSAKAVRGVMGSEWGMQDEGRASYDAVEIGEEMLLANGLKVHEDYLI